MNGTEGKWGIAKRYFSIITMNLPRRLVNEDPDLKDIKKIIKNYDDDNIKYSVYTDRVLQGSAKNRIIYIIGRGSYSNQPIITWCNLSNNCHYYEDPGRYSDEIHVQFSRYNDQYKENTVCIFEKEDDLITKTIKTRCGNKEKIDKVYFDLRGNPIFIKDETTGRALVLRHTTIK